MRFDGRGCAATQLRQRQLLTGPFAELIALLSTTPRFSTAPDPPLWGSCLALSPMQQQQRRCCRCGVQETGRVR